LGELKNWNDPDLPAPLAFAPEAMEQIRRLTLDGLLSLPRVGAGVGGLLLGKQEPGRVSVLDSVPIPCAHAFGPSFRLTDRELGEAAALAPSDHRLSVVGLYWSKTRGVADLNDDDRKLFNSLCPESWQVMLLVLPNIEVSSGSVYARGPDGSVTGGLQLPIPRIDAPAAAPEPEADPITEPKPEVAAVPPAAAPIPPSDITLFASALPVRSSLLSRLKWAAAIALLAGSGAGAFLIRDRLPSFDALMHGELSPPKLDLRSFDSRGQLIIEWNRKAVRGIDSGFLSLQDGTESRTIGLSGPQLHSGTFRYDRKTGHVTAVLRAGRVQDAVTFKAQAP
jgi:hypothetical protein